MTRNYSKWKFRSKAKRKYGRLSIRSILKLFREGKFKAEADRIYRWTGREWKLITAWRDPCRDEHTNYNPNHGTGGYWFVRIYYQQKRRAIALHKLLWILANGPIPPGYELHHLIDKDHNLPADNQLVTHDEHDALHNGYSDEVPF